jgi:hypothetical protein
MTKKKPAGAAATTAKNKTKDPKALNLQFPVVPILAWVKEKEQEKKNDPSEAEKQQKQDEQDLEEQTKSWNDYVDRHMRREKIFMDKTKKQEIWQNIVNHRVRNKVPVYSSGTYWMAPNTISEVNQQLVHNKQSLVRADRQSLH